MWPYFVMVGVPAAIAAYGQLSSRKLERRNGAIINTFFLIWLILLLFRAQVIGRDLINYEYIFLKSLDYSFGRILQLMLSFEMEPGYILLSKIVGSISLNFRWIIVISALISLLPIWYLYRKNAVNHPFLSVVLFLNIGLFSMYFSGLRQVMALAFMAPAYKYTKNKKFIPFLLTVILAFLFHKSAFIIVLFYPVYHLKLKKKIDVLAIIPIIAIVYIFKTPIFTFLGSFINDFYTINLSETGAISTFILLLIFIVFSYVIPDENKLDKDTIGLRNILVLCAILQAFAGINNLVMRMNYYFLLFVPLLLPRVIDKSTGKNRSIAQLALVVMVVFFTFNYFYMAYTDIDILQVYPYVPFWR